MTDDIIYCYSGAGLVLPVCVLVRSFLSEVRGTFSKQARSFFQQHWIVAAELVLPVQLNYLPKDRQSSTYIKLHMKWSKVKWSASHRKLLVSHTSVGRQTPMRRWTGGRGEPGRIKLLRWREMMNDPYRREYIATIVHMTSNIFSENQWSLKTTHDFWFFSGLSECWSQSLLLF